MSRLTKEARDELRRLGEPGWLSDAEMIALLDDSDEVDQLRENATSNRWFELLDQIIAAVDGELEKRGLGVNILWGFSNNEPTVRCEISERLEDLHG